MLIDSINLNHIRIFESVFRLGSMTKAAQELHLTQSGVSQHIKLLEDILHLRLFDRIKQRLIPTGAANQLFEYCSKGLYSIEKGLGQASGLDQALSGTVCVGLPIEFGNSFILPKLAEFGKKNPKVNFKIVYGFASKLNELLLNGEIDFSFLDSYTMDKSIKIIEISHEVLLLCCSQSYIKKFSGLSTSKKYFEKLEYIAYLDDYPIIKMWLSHHYNYSNLCLNVRSVSMDVQGVSKLIRAGLGVGILPEYKLNKINRLGESLHVFKGAKGPLKNTISMAYVEGRSQTPTVQSLIEVFAQGI